MRHSGTGAVTGALVALLLMLAPAAGAASSPVRAAGIGGTAYPPIGAAIDTAAPAPGGGYELQIGGNCLPNAQGCSPITVPYGADPAVLLVLTRATLKVYETIHLSGSTRDALTAMAVTESLGIGTNAGKYLVILAALPGSNMSGLFGTALYTITGASPAHSPLSGGGWAAIGIPSTPPSGQPTGVYNPGFVTENGHVEGDLRGYLTQNPATGNWSYTTGRYLAYDTHAPGSGAGTDVMMIGSARYVLRLPGTPGCTGGYGLVVVNAVNLYTQYAQAIATNCSARGQVASGLAALHAALSNAAHVQSDLVFLQSIGNPFVPGSGLHGLAAQAGHAIETLGGSAEVFNRALAAGHATAPANPAGYALVGSPSIEDDATSGAASDAHAPVAATVLTGLPARLQGLLRTDQNYNYIPVTGAAAQHTLAPSLATIVYRSASPWRTGSSAGQQKVLQYISNGMPDAKGPGTGTVYPALIYSSGSSCYDPITPDVRFEFCDLNRSYTTIATFIATFATAPAACGCTQKDWGEVTNDLTHELSYRSKVISYLASLNRVYDSGSNCTRALVELKSITQQILGAVTVSNNALIQGGRWEELGSDTLNVLSALSYSFPDAGEISNVINDLSSFGYLSGDIIGFSGNPNSLAASVNTTAAKLGPTLQNLYCAANKNFSRYEDAILTNYGSLRAAGKSPSFQLNASTLHSFAPEILAGAERFIYRHLLAVAYHPYVLLQSNGENPVAKHITPLTYTCGSNGSELHYHPWSKAPTGAWMPLSPLDPADPNTGRQALGVVFSQQIHFGDLFSIEHVPMPPQAILNTLTGSISSGGLGENATDFLLSQAPRYTVLCQTYKIFKGYRNTISGPIGLSWP